MPNETHEPPHPSGTAAGCRNTIVVVIALAVVGAWWSLGGHHEGPWARFFATLVAPSSCFVLFVTGYGLVVNWRAIVDWFVVQDPPVIEHPVLGTLRYAGMRWHAKPRDVPCGMAGRRRGPAPELVDALAHVISNLPAFEARAREHARTVVPEGETIGELSWIEALRVSRSGGVETYLHLAQAGGTEELVRVGFRGDEPVEAALH